MTERLPDVIAVSVVHDRVVHLTFDDGVAGEVNLAPTLRGPIFEEIRHDDEKFGEVRIEDGSISWPNGADLAPEVLHESVLAAYARPARH